jgi:glycosyltransferase involved in cell wall biosynthesis
MVRALLVFEPPDGGVADTVARLGAGLGAHGIEAEVAGPEASRARGPLEAAGVRYHPLPLERGYGRPARDGRALRALAALLRDRRPALLHAHAAKAGVLGRLAAVRAGLPWVYSPHCFPFVGPVGAGRRAFGVAVEGALGRLGRGTVLCVADDERREGLRHRAAPAARLQVVHNGVPPCPAAEPDPELQAFAAGGPTAGAVCVLRHQKGLDVLLDAAPALLRRVPDARLAICGDGPERAALEARHRALGLGERVRFFAFTPPAARQLAALDVFVLPSRWEAFPLAVLEALACGVPQVATDVGGTSEALLDGVTGRLVTPGQAAPLAAAVAELLEAPGRRAAMAEASRRRHAERFTAAAMVQGTAELYRRALAG